MIATDSASQAAIASLPRPNKRRAFRQSLDLQEIMMDVANDSESKGTEKAAAARAWVELHEVQRRMLGLGAPKTVPASNDPTLEPKRKRKPAAAQGEALTPDAPA